MRHGRPSSKRLHTPLKKFGSVMLMLRRILEYREAFAFSYGQSSQVDLQVLNPSVTKCPVAQNILEGLDPIMDTCILREAAESRLLSDGTSRCVTLTAELSKISQGAIVECCSRSLFFSSSEVFSQSLTKCWSEQARVTQRNNTPDPKRSSVEGVRSGEENPRFGDLAIAFAIEAYVKRSLLHQERDRRIT